MTTLPQSYQAAAEAMSEAITAKQQVALCATEWNGVITKQGELGGPRGGNRALDLSEEHTPANFFYHMT